MNAYDPKIMREATRVRNLTLDELITEFRVSDDPAVQALAQHLEDAAHDIAALEADIEQLEKEVEADCAACADKEANLEKLEDAHQDAIDRKDEEIAHLTSRIDEFASEGATKSNRITELENTMHRTIEDRLEAIENTLARVVMMIDTRSEEPVATKPKLVGSTEDNPAPAKAKPEPTEAAKEDAGGDHAIAMTDIREMAIDASKVSGKAAVKAAIEEHGGGAKKLPDVDEKHFDALYEALKPLAQREAA